MGLGEQDRDIRPLTCSSKKVWEGKNAGWTVTVKESEPQQHKRGAIPRCSAMIRVN
jgi:hypothetical protein